MLEPGKIILILPAAKLLSLGLFNDEKYYQVCLGAVCPKLGFMIIGHLQLETRDNNIHCFNITLR